MQVKNSQRGFFTFLFTLFLISIILTSYISWASSVLSISKERNIWIELEKSRFIRTELELNFDHIIEDNLSADLTKKDLIFLIHSFVTFFEEYRKEINFYSGSYTNKEYGKILFEENKGITKKSIKNLFSAPLIKNNNYVTFIMNGNPNYERNILYSLISSENSESVFMVPMNYSVIKEISIELKNKELE